MRFHDKNNAVHLLSENGPRKVAIDPHATEFPHASFFINKEFPGMRPRFRKSIQFICKPFRDAYLKAREKLVEALAKEPIQKSGTLIFSAGNQLMTTVFYDLETKRHGAEMVTNGRIAIFGSHPNQPCPSLVFYTDIRDGWSKTFQPFQSFFDGMKDSHIINDILSLLLFIKYCPVETKVVAKGKKEPHSHEDYFNKTDLPIEIVDSTWFTTIVRSEGFSVSGHFRLQPVGPGGAGRKLTWIASYDKKGYVRAAKVLSSKERDSNEVI
jgi:hypothetical protein